MGFARYSIFDAQALLDPEGLRKPRLSRPYIERSGRPSGRQRRDPTSKQGSKMRELSHRKSKTTRWPSENAIAARPSSSPICPLSGS